MQPDERSLDDLLATASGGFQQPLDNLTWPIGSGTGTTRIVAGANTPPELQSKGYDVALLFYLSNGAGIELGYWFIAVRDLPTDAWLITDYVLVIGRVKYPVPDDPTSPTAVDVLEITTHGFNAMAFSQYYASNIAGTLWDLVPGKVGQRLDGDVDTANSGAIAAVETVVLTIPSRTYLAGEAYKLTLKGQVSTAAVNGFGLFRTRKTNLAGQELGQFSRMGTSGVLGGYSACGEVVFTVGPFDITCPIALTLQGAAANAATHVGTAITPRLFDVEYAGVTSAYPNNPVLV